MATRLINLDGILIEAEVPENESRPISTNAVTKVEAHLDKIRPILVSISRPIADAWKDIDPEMNLQHAEIEVNFSFEGEGNVYISKAKAGANLSVKLVLKPKE